MFSIKITDASSIGVDASFKVIGTIGVRSAGGRRADRAILVLTPIYYINSLKIDNVFLPPSPMLIVLLHTRSRLVFKTPGQQAGRIPATRNAFSKK